MKNGSIFVLSGEELTLPFSEIRALIQIYSPDDKCERLGKRVVYSTLSDSEIVSKVASRSAYCRFGGHLISKSEGGNNDLLLKMLVTDDIVIGKGKSYAVTSETLEREAWGELGAKIKTLTGAKVSLEKPDVLFQVEKTDQGLVLAFCTNGYKKFTWRTRRPRARKFFLPSAIYPKLARLLVNLSRVREGEIFSDPFCGTGSLLIEASLMGIRTVGIDRGRWIAKGAMKNLKGFNLDTESLVIRGDSTHTYLPISHLDAVSTDVPYGRASSTRGKNTSTIIREFSSALAGILVNDDRRRVPRYAVIMRPSHVELDVDRNSFQVEEEHRIYVHRSLTRAISILRRK